MPEIHTYPDSNKKQFKEHTTAGVENVQFRWNSENETIIRTATANM